MSEQVKDQPPGPRSNPWNRLDAQVGMALAYWAYPHKSVEDAEKLVKYPKPWQHAVPGDHLPNTFKEGWNTQHSADGKLENQFKISINKETHQITIDFKGSDAWSNWTSDLGNAGASEFAKIESKAQAALDHLRQNPDFKDYKFAATGHSLGGGMAQSFALKNNIDASVYNSLPIARDTRNGDYFKDVGGYQAAMERYKAVGHTVHDVRTPNDIATYTYHGLMKNQHLSSHVGPGPTLLPGSSLPAPLKTALMLSGTGTLVAGAVMGNDHTMGALVNGQQGLALDAQGRYRIPEGHADFAQLPPEARKLFARLSESPVIKAMCSETRGMDSPSDKFVVTHEDGSRQYIEINTASGAININHHDNNGTHTLIEMNQRRNQPAKITEFDANGQPGKTEIIALHQEAPYQGGSNASHFVQANAAPDKADKRTPACSLSPQQQAQFVMAHRQTGERLQQTSLNAEEVGQVCAAAVTHCTRHADKGDPEQFYVSKDLQRLGVMHQGRQLTEMDIPQALRRGTEAHLAEAIQIARISTNQKTSTPTQSTYTQISAESAGAYKM